MDLWSQLPNGIEEHVLSFVPVPNLCRNRSVCKGWNRIISDPNLGALCVQNQPKEHAPFLILHCDVSQQFCILDLSARRWYQHAGAHEASLRDIFFVLSMDGGLVLCEYSSTESQPSALAVYNPLDKAEEEVPLAPDDLSRPIRLSLVVDNIAQSFNIIRLEEPLGERSKILNNPTLQIYNSTTKEWKGLTNQWCKFETQPGDEAYAWPLSSVVFQQCLYVLFSHTSRSAVTTLQIWRYDLLKAGSWENVSLLMDTSFKPLDTGRLIVSANRLFFVSSPVIRSPVRMDFSQFEVIEINICRMTCETVFAWTKAQALEVFDVEDDGNLDYLYIHVFGFDNSLMFMLGGSIPGNLRAFDFVTRKWDCEWPRLLLGNLPSGELRYWTGKQMNFLLPGTPW